MKLFVVKALASRLVGGGDGFVCRGVVRLFCFLKGGVVFCVDSFCLVREGNSYAESCAFGSSYDEMFFAFLRGGATCLFDSHKVVWAPPFCLTATKSFNYMFLYDTVRGGTAR